MAATTAASDATEGPVLNLISKRLRALRKKYNRILQMEESVSQGKPLNKEQEEVLRSKPSVFAAIDELEKLRSPLSSAVADEIRLALQNHKNEGTKADAVTATEPNHEEEQVVRETNGNADVAEDLLNLLYFGSLFDVKSQSDFTSMMLTRTHERGCCLTYDYVTDEAVDLLSEKDLDLISLLGGLMISRPVDSGLSHKSALQRCIEHAKLWIANSDQAIDSNSNVSYKELRERLKKIMVSDYFTTTPEMKAPVDVAAAAAAGNYGSFQVPVQGVPIAVPVQVEGCVAGYQPTDEDAANVQDHETGDIYQPSNAEEVQKDELEMENSAELAPEQHEAKPMTEVEHFQRDEEPRDRQYRRNYQNQRGGRGGGGRRGGYSNGRGGRSGGRGGGGYQNGRSQFYDNMGNHYQRNYYNNRGRGGRGGGYQYNNHSGGTQGGE